MNTEMVNLSRRDVVKLGGAAGLATAVVMLAGCSSNSGGSSSSASSSAASSSASPSAAAASLDGKTLNIYCGAGMKEPFAETAQNFQDETGCTMNVTYANAAQIQTQIETSQSGDIWIAGSTDEAERVSSLTAESVNLVKHIPVIIVPKDNPKNVQSLADLANVDTLLIGDPDSVAIGKVAKNALTKAGIWDAVADKVTTTTTAPQISSAIANGQGDAGIVWKENASDNVTIVGQADMDKFIKVIPAVVLTTSQDKDTVDDFVDYLESSKAQDVWTKHGYEIA